MLPQQGRERRTSCPITLSVTSQPLEARNLWWEVANEGRLRHVSTLYALIQRAASAEHPACDVSKHAARIEEMGRDM